MVSGTSAREPAHGRGLARPRIKSDGGIVDGAVNGIGNLCAIWRRCFFLTSTAAFTLPLLCPCSKNGSARAAQYLR
jgi:hypothetical protein